MHEGGVLRGLLDLFEVWIFHENRVPTSTKQLTRLNVELDPGAMSAMVPLLRFLMIESKIWRFPPDPVMNVRPMVVIWRNLTVTLAAGGWMVTNVVLVAVKRMSMESKTSVKSPVPDGLVLVMRIPAGNTRMLLPEDP